MKYFLIFCLTVVFFVSVPTQAKLSDQWMPVTPEPQEWRRLDGSFQISGQITVFADPSFESQLIFLQEILEECCNPQMDVRSIDQNQLPDAGIIVAPFTADGQIAEIAAGLGIQSRPNINEEGYLLIVQSDRILLSASSEKGIFYGIQSLGFLLNAYKDQKQMPAVAIRDWPDLKMRGITDDFSRGQVSTLDNFKKIIRFLARHKMNVYMPYMEDLYQFDNYPSIGKNRGALTKAEIIELQDYAEKYHVKIIPIFQTLGHYENILLMPEFRHLAEFPGAASLNINNPEIYDFLDKMLAEIVPLFRSEYFHIGADESWDVGKYATARLAERHGLASVHAMHYRRIFKMLEKYDKKIMMYGDIILNHPTILNEIPKDIIMFDWHYWPAVHYSSAETFSKAGQPFIVSAGVHNWRRIFPNMIDALANIKQLTLDGYNNGAIGSITSNWGDYGAMNLREFNYYPYAYSAAVSWNTNEADLFDFEKRFMARFFGSSDPALANIYHILNDMSAQIDWLRMVGHPFYPIEENMINLTRRAHSFDHYGRQLNRTIEALRGQLNHNQEYPDYLEFASDVYQWCGRLDQLKIKLHRINSFHIDKNDRDKFKPELQKNLKDLAGQINQLGSRFADLWKRTNKQDNLQRMLAHFTRLEKYLNIKSGEIAEDNFGFNGKIPAPFISHPAATQGENASVPVIYLRKNFNLEQKADEAWLQLIADSHGKIWINGNEIGQVLARKSLSAWVESERVKAWEISRYLKKGKNVVAVQVKNYRGGQAAANVWLELKNGAEWQTPITSSIYWKVSDRSEAGWQSVRFDDSYWLPAVTVDKVFVISRPYFERDLPSRIEYYQ